MPAALVRALVTPRNGRPPHPGQLGPQAPHWHCPALTGHPPPEDHLRPRLLQTDPEARTTLPAPSQRRRARPPDGQQRGRRMLDSPTSRAGARGRAERLRVGACLPTVSSPRRLPTPSSPVQPPQESHTSPPGPQDDFSATGKKWPQMCNDPAGLGWFLSPGPLQVEWRGYDLTRQRRHGPQRGEGEDMGSPESPHAHGAWPPACQASPPSLHPTPQDAFLKHRLAHLACGTPEGPKRAPRAPPTQSCPSLHPRLSHLPPLDQRFVRAKPRPQPLDCPDSQ